MVWDAGEGHTLFLTNRARCERDLKLAGHDLGVLIESLVEVTETEEEDGVRVTALDIEILAA